jgi:hypothetical protein
MQTTSDCNPPLGYVSPFFRDVKTCHDGSKGLILSPWTVQNICYELIANYMLTNSPGDMGFVFSQRYDRDPRKTGIFLDIALNYKDDVVQKRPAVFVGRGPADFRYPTMNQMIGGNSRESVKQKMAIITMPVMITTVATNVGFVEQLSDYISRVFIEYAEQIREDFRFRIFKLENLSNPTLYLESKDHFAIGLNLTTSFDLGFTVTGDHLKLKTMSSTVFTSCTELPLFNQ